MGYKEDFLKTAKQNMELIKESGAKTLVTGCADCYHAFKVLYDQFGMKGDLEVLHNTEYLDRLIKAGKLKSTKKVVSSVTYQDPCGLGRKGEPYIHAEGKEIPGHMRLFDPPKEFRRGAYGVYQPPRDVLKSIPGLKLTEMHRRRGKGIKSGFRPVDCSGQSCRSRRDRSGSSRNCMSRLQAEFHRRRQGQWEQSQNIRYC
jgi:Fe-S oxidoreductase